MIAVATVIWSSRALDRGPAGERVGPAEHVGQAASLARVQQDEHDQEQGREDLHDEDEGVQHGPRICTERSGRLARSATAALR